MRDLFKSLKQLGVGDGARRLLAFGQAAQAANPLELNFWLSGPRYDGRVAECERALPTISYPIPGKREQVLEFPAGHHRPMAGSTRPRSGPGSPTTFRAAIAPATSC